MRKADFAMLVSRGDRVAMVSFGALAVSIPFWLPWFLDAYTLAFLGHALFRMMCF